MLIQKLDTIFLVKLSKNYLKNFDIFDREQIQDLFQLILTKIRKKNYLNGLLDVNVYVDPDYGMIIEIDPIETVFKEIDMHIHFHLDVLFLNEITSQELLNNKKLYYYQGKFYSPYQEKTDNKVIYKESNEILEKGIKIYKK